MIPFLNEIIGKVGGIVDNLVTTDAEKLKLQADLEKIKVDGEKSLNNHMDNVVKGQTEILKIEYKNGGWLQRSWRPLLGITLTAILAWLFIGIDVAVMLRDQFDLNFYVPAKESLPTEFWYLITACLTSGIIGRSFEKSRR